MVPVAGFEPAHHLPLKQQPLPFGYTGEMVSSGRLELPKLRGLNAHCMPIPDKATTTCADPRSSVIPRLGGLHALWIISIERRARCSRVRSAGEPTPMELSGGFDPPSPRYQRGALPNKLRQLNPFIPLKPEWPDSNFNCLMRFLAQAIVGFLVMETPFTQGEV